MTNPDNPKHQLRNRIRQALRGLTPDSTPAQAASHAWLAARPELRTVAVFAAMPGEIDLLPLVAWNPDRRWVFPRVVGDDLVWHVVQDPVADLVPGTLGIREPAPTLPTVAAPEVDVFFCPGLAFDDRGGRLGRGRGYYDRTLAEARPEAMKIGICHPLQRVPDTFSEAHDHPMHAVICA